MYNYTLMSDTAESLGMTNRDIANALSMSESTVSRYLSGTVKEPNHEIVCDLCELLHLDHLPISVISGREDMTDLPSKEGEDFTENLLIIRDFVRRNYERLRNIEHEKDAAFNRHIDHLKEQLDGKDASATQHAQHLTMQLDKYSRQFSRFNAAIYSLIALSAIMLGIMIMMFVNNRSLNAQVRDLQTHIMECPGEYNNEEDFPE